MPAGTPSGSEILNGLLDVDTEDTECPLCLEEMDVSDLNFKPCPCGYRICRFCWHHIKENLNGRCPACRKEYSDDAVEFTPVRADEMKKLQTAKKQKEREKKEGEVNSRKHLANVRIKQKTQAHIQGMTSRIANEDSIPYLKSNDVFGQYGKILKLFLAKRTNMPADMNAAVLADSKNQPVNVYINYSSSREASACILATDAMSFEGHRLRAGWGTTKYCPAFLRGQKCTQENCMMAHEHGDEVDPVGGAPGPVTREEMSTLKHAMKEQDSRDQRAGGRSGSATLPATASWAKTPGPPLASPSTSATPPTPIHRPIASNATRLPKATTHPLPARPPSREAHVAAASARTRQGSVQSMVGPTTRRSSTSSSVDDKNLLRRASIIDASSEVVSSPISEQPAPLPAPRVGPPPGLSRAAEPSPAPVASTSATPISQHIVAPEGEAVYLENDYEEDPFGASLGSFSFNLNINFPGSSITSEHSIDREKPDLSWIDTSVGGADGPSGIDYLVSSSSAALPSGALPSGIPATINRSASQEGYSGAFDPFAETPGDAEPSFRPRSSRFDFAKKGLFGSTDSLSSLGLTSIAPDQSSRTNLNNGRASPLSILTASTAIRTNSPKRGVISPPPGLKSASPANDALFPLRSGSPGGGDLPSFPRMPLSAAATQALPFSAHMLPSMGDLASRPLPAALSSASAHPLPPPKSGPPGLNRSMGHEDPYTHLMSGASAPLPPRPGLNSGEHILSDPAILNMSSAPRFPSIGSPNLAFNPLDQTFGGFYGQQQPGQQSFVPFR